MGSSERLKRLNHLLPIIVAELIIAFGVVLRLVLLFQNRNLIIDEANIVRNLSERGFGALALPLKYEQYAPPVFLWVEKLFSIILGYGEKAMRLYPLLTGIAALLVFYEVAKRLMPRAVIWWPMALLAFGNIFIKYSAELKQYMPDTCIALVLILAALTWDFERMPRKNFILRWVIAGSLAIWSSMPSVFILTGVGCYYAWPLLRNKKLREIGPLLIIGGVWFAQFVFYYIAILRPQINSEYLQNYHREYFLFATPENRDEWLHNWELIEQILKNIGGVTTVAIVTNLGLMLLGTVVLAAKRMQHFLLVALPIGLVLIAAALKQFSLIERVVLFAMPLGMLLIGVGLATLWRLALPVRFFFLILGGYIIWCYNGFWLFREKLGFHEITEGMAWIEAKGGRGSQLYVHDANVPTYIYYTELHPRKAHWAQLLGARRLAWQDDYTEVSRDIKDTAYFLYTGGFAEGERNRRTKQLETHLRQIDYFEKYICYVFEYVPKPAQDTVTVPGTTPN